MIGPKNIFEYCKFYIPISMVVKIRYEDMFS